ncbi:unnamed protein product [Caenorhabditis angaria]|uniref:Uncharacterized protein n=1 Tax=Caenorhabditis angaria TaxID=860376 RepID=A0A9P1IGM5_9PELO|nr:unnamed protein product [Caenorhabditis angaria]
MRFNTTFHCNLNIFARSPSFSISFRDKDKYSAADPITYIFYRMFETNKFHEVFDGAIHNDEFGSKNYWIYMWLRHDCFNDGKFQRFYIGLSEPCPLDKNCHYDINLDLTNYINKPWGYLVKNSYFY